MIKKLLLISTIFLLFGCTNEKLNNNYDKTGSVEEKASIPSSVSTKENYNQTSTTTTTTTTTTSSKPTTTVKSTTTTTKASNNQTTSTTKKVTTKTTSVVTKQANTTKPTTTTSTTTTKTTTTTKALTTKEVYNAMIALKSKYPDGTPWTNDNSYSWKGGIYNIGYGCAGFAFMVSDAAFGSRKATKHTNFDNIKVGDIIRMYNNTHSVIVLAIDNETYTIAEGNMNNSVLWGRKISLSSIKSTGTYVLTRW